MRRTSDERQGLSGIRLFFLRLSPDIRMDISSVPGGPDHVVPGPMPLSAAVAACEEERRQAELASEIEQSLEEEEEEERKGVKVGRKRVQFSDGVGISLTSEFDDSNLWAHGERKWSGRGL